MPKLKINDIEIEVAPGTSILQAAEQLGIEIPRFCYHDKLSVPANCRMCLVEVAPGPPKPQASCALACADGMTVKTDSEVVRKARKGVMEMLLINHPLDCPICDQGGECDLQDQAVSYGFDRSRYYENKRAKQNPDLGPLVKTSMNRCIQCTRCVRFLDEIAGTGELGYLHRGEDAEITTFISRAVETELSGNLVDVCPVGALLNGPYSFRARPWELTKTESIDVHDAVGSNIRIDARGGEVMRILPRLNEDVNEEWIGDRTRFAFDGLRARRLDRPWVRENGKLREASWEEAFAAIAPQLKKSKLGTTAALAGDLCDLESMVALNDLMALNGGAQLECRSDGAQFDASQRCGYIFNSGIAAIEQADAILLVGTNPRHEATMVNARIRKAWLAKRVKVGMIGPALDLTYPYTHIGAGPGDLESLVAGKHAFAKVLEGAKNPMIIVGMSAFCREDGAAVQALAHEVVEKFNMAREDWNGFNVLHNAAARVGALDIGFFTEGGIDLSSMNFIWLLGADDFNLPTISPKAFVVYQGHHGDAGAHHADVILPGAAYTEKDGLYVNTEGRVQAARRAVDPPGQAREDWKILRALSPFTGKVLPYNDLFQLRQRIAKEWPHLNNLDVLQPAPWTKFGSKGKVLKDAFKVSDESYYLTNAICRASKTMHECVREFGKQGAQQERMEAAE
jgi:NADH-quinone oxidoreductase subunit G